MKSHSTDSKYINTASTLFASDVLINIHFEAFIHIPPWIATNSLEMMYRLIKQWI